MIKRESSKRIQPSGSPGLRAELRRESDEKPDSANSPRTSGAATFFRASNKLLAFTLLLSTLPELGWTQNGSHELSSDNLDQLLNAEVTTVSRIPEKRSRVSAAVYVITQEDIRRSGATSIPEALRLVPGVHVAKVDSNKWSIGIRGFGSRLSRSMLVMIDGRSVYSPLFAGTYWEVQDTLLEDIDRIEVIRGPGSSLWGANSFNGIINIITKDAKSTQGTLVTAGGGSEEQGFVGFRYGGKAGQDSYYRVYGKFFNRDAAFHANGQNFDDWRMGQTGFRADWTLPKDRTFTLQGDLYSGVSGQRGAITTYQPPFTQVVEDNADLSGGNLLGRLGGPIGEKSDFALQFYYDRTNRQEPTFGENRDTLDIDFQYHLYPRPRHELAFGLGYRLSSGNTNSIPTIQFSPNRRTDNLFSTFFQDEIQLVGEQLYLIVGSKFEHNGYSGFEAQPSGRLLWTPSPRHNFRATVARAVRTPSRVEHDLELTALLQPTSPPAFLRLVSNKEFQSEKLHGYELGYQVRPAKRLFVTFSGFFDDYDDLLSIEAMNPFFETSPAPPHTVLPLQEQNLLQGHTHGGEVVTDWRVTNWWRVNGSYSYLRMNLKRDPNSRDFSTERSMEGASPRHLLSYQSSMNLRGGLELDWMFRFVSGLPSRGIPKYATSDVRLGWRPTRRVDLSVVGKDLHQPHHPEVSGSASEVERSVYGKVTWQW